MATSLNMSHVSTNKPRLYYLNLSIKLSQGSSLLFVLVLTLPSFWCYFKFNLGTLLVTCLGISIKFHLRVLITRISVIAHESISVAEENISFFFLREVSLSIKVNSFEGTILNLLQ